MLRKIRLPSCCGTMDSANCRKGTKMKVRKSMNEAILSAIVAEVRSRWGRGEDRDECGYGCEII